MTSPNNLGYVTEFTADRSLTGPDTFQLKLKLKNTLGEERIVWVDASPDLFEFFSSDLEEATKERYPEVQGAKTVSDLADQLSRDLNGEKDYHDLVVTACEEVEASRHQFFKQVIDQVDGELKERLRRVDEEHSEKLKTRLDALRVAR